VVNRLDLRLAKETALSGSHFALLAFWADTAQLEAGFFHKPAVFGFHSFFDGL
jgi:hypothetical protein